MADGELEALRAFRAGLFVGFGRRRDALLEVLDALLTAGPCPSLPHLSLAPGHRRGWASVSAALRRGHVHAEALRALLLRQPAPDGPPLYAVDVSVWPRAGAATSPERGSQDHAPRRRDGHDPIVPGWAYQWLTRLSWDRDSWTAPVDVRRVRPGEKPPAVAVEQLTALVAARPAAQRAAAPLVLFDAGYDACGFTHALAGAPVALLIRLRSNRHCWFAPTRTTPHPRGRPKRHGAKLVCNDPATRPAPTTELHVAAALGRTVAFVRLVQERDADGLGLWLAAAARSAEVELREFAASLARDRAAVEAALRLPGSTGPVEGLITKLKLAKRATYGRAGLPLLRARLLSAA